MSDLKFKFTIQPYQTEAVKSIIDTFAGQPFDDHFTYRRDIEIEKDFFNFNNFDDEIYMGFKNADLTLDSKDLLENIQNIQSRNNIRQSNSLTKDRMGACSLDVEMETGSGKTYVYIKTIFELNKQYGWSKFIVIVPSIAIREGVKKNFEILTDHFMEHYGKKARFFVYDSSNLGQIDNFSQSADINVMIINTQAFNSRKKQDRRIYQELDEFGSRRPIDIIKANHPILILDEPQKMGGKATKQALKEFEPLFTLNFSATHKDHHDLVYVLDALDAYNQKLVKKIKVKGLDIKNLRGTNSYLYFDEILLSPNKPPRARLELEISYKNGIKRESRIVVVDDDLFPISKEMEQYRGYRVSEIDPLKNSITFTNGIKLNTGQILGDVSEKDIRRIQIRETIRSHFQKEKELFEKGIKVLSLFFIDEVAKYRQYDEEGNELNSEYGQMFEEEYNLILNEYLSSYNTPYEEYLKSIQVSETHAGYFSIDKKGHKVNSKPRRGTDVSDDISAYDLILKDKEKLLSLDNPVRFIFSHSALREGWDNPNVFQICALKHEGTSPTQKRQEVGRGLRLCVDQEGNRMDLTTLGDQVHEVNQLTVIASDGFQDFVAGLQQGIREDLYDRPEKASINYFAGKTIVLNEKEKSISREQAKDIYSYLKQNNYVDKNDHITKLYRSDVDNRTLAPVPESCEEISIGVHALIQSIYDEHALDGMIGNALETELKGNPINKNNFYKDEFQKLWNYINHQYTYTVDFDSDELINKAVESIDENLFVTRLQYKLTESEQVKELDAKMIKEGKGFKEGKTSTKLLDHHESSQVKYDLIGKIASGAKLTRKTAAAILSKIKPETFNQFRENPEEFISKVIQLITEQKASMIVEDIVYNPTDQTYDSTIFSTNAKADFKKAYKAKKNVQEWVITDGLADKSVERKFAEELDKAEEVSVYAKLPKGFSIPTPVGSYSPDWAIAFKKGSVKHIFFIAETKGSMSSLQLRGIEEAKIKCARKLFNEISSEDIVYHEVNSYENLLNVMEKI